MGIWGYRGEVWGYRVGIWGCRVRIWGYRGGDARLQGAGT